VHQDQKHLIKCHAKRRHLSEVASSLLFHSSALLILLPRRPTALKKLTQTWLLGNHPKQRHFQSSFSRGRAFPADTYHQIAIERSDVCGLMHPFSPFKYTEWSAHTLGRKCCALCWRAILKYGLVLAMKRTEKHRLLECYKSDFEHRQKNRLQA